MNVEAVTGRCSGMCPEEEMNTRESKQLLHYFEMKPETRRARKPRAERSQMVKEYQRSAAGKADPRPQDIRPPSVLLNCVNYLIDEILTRPEPWSLCYSYVFDRLRAVRQDLVIQRASGPEVINIMEKIARFHVYSGYRLCEESLSKFDPVMNATHTAECLERVLVLYRDEGLSTSPAAAHIHALYLLHNLGNAHSLALALQHKHCFRHSKDFCLALNMGLACWTHDYGRVFRLSRRLSALCLCAFHYQLPSLYRQILSRFMVAYRSRTLAYDLSDLAQLLTFNNSDAVRGMCKEAGLTVDNRGVHFTGHTLPPDIKLKPRHFDFIQNLLDSWENSVSALIHGQGTHGNPDN